MKNDKIYREAYDNGTPLVPDYVYDAAFGTTETELDENRQGTLMKHEHPMLSLPTFFVNLDTLSNEELLGYGVDANQLLVISYKIDGVPCSAIWEGGKWSRALSRGKRFEGYLLNKAFLDILPTPRNLYDNIVYDFRGEFVIKKKDFEELNNALPENERYANPRSMVSAQINSDNPNPAILAKMQWLAHGLWHSNNAPLHMQALLQHLPESSLAPFVSIDNANMVVSQVRSMYIQAMQCDYPCDGIVIQHSCTAANDGRCNLDRIAVKQFDEAKYSADTEVTKIEWRLANNGSYFPRLWFKPVQINGSEVTHAAAYCWDYVNKLGLSLGAKVRVTMRGGVIPYVSKVLMIGSGDYQLPADTAPIEQSDIHIWSTNSEDAVQRLRFIRGMQMLDLENVGTESFSKLYDAGCKTIFDLKGLTVNNVIAKGMTNTPTTYMMVQTINNRISTFNYVWCILALRFPGIGFKAANIIGQYLSGYQLRPEVKFNKAIQAFLATDLTQKVKDIAKPVAPEHADLAILDRPQQAHNQKLVCLSKKPTNGMKKAEFFKQYLATEYNETGDIKVADLLVCPRGEQSNKIAYAKANNIAIKYYDEF